MAAVSLLSAITVNVQCIAEPATQVWTERETGIQTAGWSAIELTDGRMAFGGHSLIIFDGDNWNSYNIGTAYAVRALRLGKSGIIWAGAVNELGYFEPKPDGRFEYHSLKASLPEEIKDFSVWHIFEIGEKILFVTTKNLLLWDSNRFSSWHIDSPGYVKAFDTNIGALIQDRKTGLLLFDYNGPRTIIPANSYENKTISFCNIRDDRLEVICEGRTWIYSIGEEKGSTLLGNTINQTPSAVNHTIRLKSGATAYATNDSGIHIINLGSLDGVQKVQGPFARSIMHLYESSDGALWALGRDHIARISFNHQVYSESDGITGGQITAIGSLGRQIIVSTDDGLFAQFGDLFEPIKQIPKLRAWSIRSIDRKNIAIATTGGTWIYNGLSGYRVSGSSSTFAFEDTNMPRFLVGNEAGVQLVDPTSGTADYVVRGIPDIATSITREDDDVFWIGTATKGLLRSTISERLVSSVDVKDDDNRTRSDYGAMIFSVGKTLVAAIEDQLFYKLPQDKHFTPLSGFRGTVAHVSNRDTDGSVWLSLSSDPSKGLTNRIGRLTASERGIAWFPIEFPFHARQGTPFPIFVREDDVLVGSPVGLVAFKKSADLAPAKPKQPLLILETSPPQRDSSEIPLFTYEGAQIKFRYGSLEFSQREALRFQTRLKGIDSDWSPPSNEPARVLTGLRDGVHEFLVRSTVDGFVSSPSTYIFQISPPWWRSRGAYTAYIIGTLCAFTFAVRLRDGLQRSRSRYLEGIVEERTEQLRQANDAKTEFVTAMSHDVRTPINGIMGTTLELSRTGLSADQALLVRRIQACSNMLCTLVEDVLDFAAIESGRALISDAPFSPQSLLDSVITILQASTPDSSQRIDCSIDSDVPSWLRGDEDRIRQIMVNYGSNALKYAGADTVTLRIRRSGCFAIFSVIDRGPGIPESAQRKLFSRFSRLHAHPGKEGKGLGLAGCRVIARLMNGSVGVRSGVGEGSEFWLRIPLHEAEASELSADSNGSFSYAQRALLVEDVHYSAEASKSVLCSLGFAVEVAVTGREAIARLAQDRFDVVFLDVNLPDITGTQVTSAIRSLEGLGASVKILATTAHSTVDHKAECIKAGMDGFVSKPLTPDKVRQALARANMFSSEGEPESSRVSFAMLDFLSNGSIFELQRHAGLLMKGIDEEVRALALAFASRDREKLRRIAHRLITHARLAGDPSLIELSASLESLSDYEAFDAIAEHISRITTEVASIRGRLEDHVRRAGSA